MKTVHIVVGVFLIVVCGGLLITSLVTAGLGTFTSAYSSMVEILDFVAFVAGIGLVVFGLLPDPMKKGKK